MKYAVIILLVIAMLTMVACSPFIAVEENGEHDTQECLQLAAGPITITECEGYTVIFMREDEFVKIDAFDHYPAEIEIESIAPADYDRIYVIFDKESV